MAFVFSATEPSTVPGMTALDREARKIMTAVLILTLTYAQYVFNAVAKCKSHKGWEIQHNNFQVDTISIL